MKALIVLALTLIGIKVSMAADPVCTTGQTDIIFALDTSRSVTARKFTLQKQFAADISAAFKVGPGDTRFGALKFSHTLGASMFYPYEYSTNRDIYQDLLTRSRTVTTDESDATAGLDFAKHMMLKDRPTATRIVIIITAGQSPQPIKAKEAAMVLKNMKATILAIGVGNHSQSELFDIASQPDYVFKVDSYEVIRTLEDDVIKKICQVTSGDFHPPCPNGQVVGSQCLTLSSQKMTKADATQSCVANNGGKIFEIRSEELYIRLGAIAEENGLELWAGAEKAAEGDWKWISDNSSATLPQKWFKCGEPNNWRGNEKCLQMRPNGKLNNASCDKRFHFVCVN